MPLLYKKQDHTGILTLSRPEARNCFEQDYADGPLQRLEEAADDDEVRSVILTGDEAGGGLGGWPSGSKPRTVKPYTITGVRISGSHQSMTPQTGTVGPEVSRRIWWRMP
jgi:hypothetical protein